MDPMANSGWISVAPPGTGLASGENFGVVKFRGLPPGEVGAKIFGVGVSGSGEPANSGYPGSGLASGFPGVSGFSGFVQN